MKIATVSKIQQVEENFSIFQKLGLELDLERILIREFDAGLPSDIDHPA